MWQQTTAPIGNVSWQAALQYCDGLELPEYEDWRLPNLRELQSIADYGRYSPASDPGFATVSDWYWSSTSNPQWPHYAACVGFTYGIIGGNTKDHHCCVRAVRTVQ